MPGAAVALAEAVHLVVGEDEEAVRVMLERREAQDRVGATLRPWQTRTLNPKQNSRVPKSQKILIWATTRENRRTGIKKKEILLTVPQSRQKYCGVIGTIFLFFLHRS